MKINYPILGYAPGSYMNKCYKCEEDFMGDKYARQCEPCAINLLNEGNKVALVKIKELESTLNKIKEAYKIMKELSKEL